MIGNKHTFLGTNIEIKDKIIQDDMVEQLEEQITGFGEDVSMSASTAPTKNVLK